MLHRASTNKNEEGVISVRLTPVKYPIGDPCFTGQVAGADKLYRLWRGGFVEIGGIIPFNRVRGRCLFGLPYCVLVVLPDNLILLLYGDTTIE